MKRCILFFAILGIMAVNSVQGQVTTVASGNCGAQGNNLTWVLTSDSVLTISGNGDMADYSVNSVPWYSNRSKIKTIIIEDSVTSIGKDAFSYCGSLISVTIPDSITNIGEDAFNNCTKLQIVNFNAINCTMASGNAGTRVFAGCAAFTLNIGNNVKIIPDGAFGGCILDSVIIPDNVTSIGNSAFLNCTALASIIIGNGVTSIGSNAFSNCRSLVSIIIPNSVKNIGGDAFMMSGLTAVIIPNSVTDIGAGAFSFSNLTSVTIGDSVTNVGIHTFRNCTYLQTVNYNAINCITMGGDSWSPVFEGCFSFTTLNIGNKVKTIPHVAFVYCRNLTSLTIPDSVISIGNAAFGGCNGLTSITSYAVNPPALGTDAFTYVSIYIPIHIPCFTYNSYRTAGRWSNFTNFVINGSDTIFYNAVKCSLPYTDNNFTTPINSAGAYYTTLANNGIGCDTVICLTLMSISHTDYSATICQGTSYTDNNFTNLTQAGIYYDTLQSVYGCDSIIKFTLGIYPNVAITNYTVNICNSNVYSDNNFTNLAQAGIYYDTLQNINGCDSIICLTLTSDTSRGGITGSLTWHFNLCDSTLTISGSGTMPNYTTNNTPWNSYQTAIRTVVISNGVTNIGNYAFRDCNRLNSVTIGNSVTNIGSFVFNGCINLTSITIPNGVTDIGSDAFLNCHNLISITIPNGVTNIGNYAFYGCRNLTFITCKAITPPVLGGINAFYNVPKNIPIYVPCQSHNSYISASGWSSFTNYVNSIDTNFYNVVKCYNVSYTDNNFTTPIDSAGIYYRTFSIGSGCDSVVCLMLTENPYIPVTNYSATICQGTSHTDANFTNLTLSGIHYDTLQNINGCDSIICLTLSEYPYVPITYYSDTICMGNNYMDNNFINLTQTGIYYDTLQNTNGCDSIVCLNLTVNPVSVTNYSAIICQGGTYADNHFTNLTQTGTYYDTLQNIYGCDSIICLSLFVDTVVITNYAINICQGSIYNDNHFTNLTQSGTYYDTLQNINGCDSIICLTLSEYPQTPITYDTAYFCQGSSYTDANFQNLTLSGTYCDTLQNINGCDSIIELTLDYYPQTPITNYFASFYIGNPYSDANFQNLTQAGIYYDTLVNTNGCDSIVCLTLTGLNASISGVVIRQDLTPLDAGLVELYEVQNGGQYILSDTITVSNSGSYIFENVSDGDYVVKFIPDSSENALPTYYGNTEFWDSARIVTIANNLPADSIDITLISLNPLNGNSLISGYVGLDSNRQKSLSQKSVSRPAEDVNVYLQQEQSLDWTTVAQTLTNLEGYFEFKNVPAGRYRVILDVAGLEIDNPQVIEIKDKDTIKNIAYEITKSGISNKTNDVGIVSITLNNQLRVYPNPTNGQLTMNNEELIIENIEIYDIVGQMVGTYPCGRPEMTIDVSHLANGLYYLKIDNRIVKFVKE